MSRKALLIAHARHGQGDPRQIEQVRKNLPFVLRTALGLAGLAVAVNLVTVVVVAVITVTMNAKADSDEVRAVIIAAAISAAVAVVIGVTAGALLQRRTMRWLLRGEQPSSDDARRALRLPTQLAVLTIVLWVLGAAAVAVTSTAVGQSGQTTFGIAAGTVLAGLVASGLTYLLVTTVNQRVALLALAACPPRDNPVFGLSWRMVINWALTTATPIAALLFALDAPRDKTHIVGVSIAVAILAIVVSGMSALLSARSIGRPLRSLSTAMRRVKDGELDLQLPVEDAGEIGLVENGFNEMVAGLRERERIQDLFGRHVGSAVAAEAISSGVTMRGECRDVVALFVDITGSTQVTRTVEPTEFVARLNRFFEVVVDEVERNGGLLNKFEGDAALCVFGAPAELADPATAALRTARAIRDRVAAMAEFDIGIGVAAGAAIAGQIGSASRLEYTVIGDAVNEAARLTEQAKRDPGRVLASGTTVEAASADEQAHWLIGRTIRLRGRETATRTYRCEPADPRGGSAHSLTQRLGDVARGVAELAIGRHPDA